MNATWLFIILKLTKNHKRFLHLAKHHKWFVKPVACFANWTTDSWCSSWQWYLWDVQWLLPHCNLPNPWPPMIHKHHICSKIRSSSLIKGNIEICRYKPLSSSFQSTWRVFHLSKSQCWTGSNVKSILDGIQILLGHG